MIFYFEILNEKKTRDIYITKITFNKNDTFYFR